MTTALRKTQRRFCLCDRDCVGRMPAGVRPASASFSAMLRPPRSQQLVPRKYVCIRTGEGEGRNVARISVQGAAGD